MAETPQELPAKEGQSTEMKELEQNLYDHITFIYGAEQAEKIFRRINQRLENFRAEYPDLAASNPSERVSENDTILITYGDMVRQDGEAPLQTLASFLQKHLADVVSTIHILPFYPYSSDDGFSVIDYKQVNPDFGDWEDVAKLGENFRLMFDAVVNHVSAESVWFQGFLGGEPDFENYFTVIENGVDLSRVFRPRATPVLTPFETARGKKWVWTTFSADQIDLNFANPEVLLEVIDILLFYAANGADFIRLDAVTFVWKEIGTTCVNSAHTHRIVQCIRTIFDLAAPKVAVITETNVPHEDNIAYFGDGTNEAQMVYNFALPLLTLNAFQTGDVRTLSTWADTLDLPSDQATFFNFLACHDGVGMLPVKNILSLEDINQVVDRTHTLGGFVSYKSNEDGSQSPYELNINYLDALNDPEVFAKQVEHMDELNINYLDALSDPENRGKAVEFVAKRFLATQSIMLALRGVPGIYFHSLFGSRNWKAGVDETGRYRTINREKLERQQVEAELADSSSLRYHVFRGFHHLLKVRKTNPAFHPWSGQQILEFDQAIFALLRTSIDGKVQTLCLTNVTDQAKEITINDEFLPTQGESTLIEIITETKYKLTEGALKFNHSPLSSFMAANPMNPERLMTKSLRASPNGERVARIMAAALEAVDPAKAVEQHLKRDGNQLKIENQVYDLDSFDRVLLIGFGKACIPMGDAGSKILGEFLSSGVLITKANLAGGKISSDKQQVPIFEGGHPVPDQRSIEGAQSIVDLLSTTTEKDLAIFLISGGGSALLTLPAPGILLDDIQTLTKSLFACGATINEINCLRKHLSQVKGGQLAQIAAPAQMISLILSDVVGDPLDVIASGPTVPDSTTHTDALAIFEKYEISDQVPQSILNHLQRGAQAEIADTPKPGDPIFEQVRNIIIGNNYQAAKAAIKQAEAAGFNTLLLTTSLQGEAKIAGQMLAAIAKQVIATGEPIPRPACIIVGGETTVTIRGDGLGGRNQELALGAVEELAGLGDVVLIALATDGDDGPTDAAGAVVTGNTLSRANLLGLNPSEFLTRNASYEFFDPLGDLLKPGPTQTNVNDLTFLIIY